MEHFGREAPGSVVLDLKERERERGREALISRRKWHRQSEFYTHQAIKREASASTVTGV